MEEATANVGGLSSLQLCGPTHSNVDSLFKCVDMAAITVIHTHDQHPHWLHWG